MSEPIERMARYQDDLARLLTALDPMERAEVLDGVREHIDVALAEIQREPTEADIDRILGGLGPPGMVAEAALAERPEISEPNAGPGELDAALSKLSAGLTGRWVPPVALSLLLIGGAVMLLGYPLLLVAAGIFMVLGSPLWVRREKLWAAIALPACASMFIGHLLLTRWHVELGPFSAADIAGILGLTAALVIFVVLLIRGARRAMHLAQDQKAGR